MAGISVAKMKRKELEEVSDEFSEFSLSSPARKIRRLDAELPPIMEEEDPPVMMVFKDQQPPSANNQQMMNTGMIPEFNEERSIVLYKPVAANNPSSLLAYCDTNVLYKVSPHILAGIKNQAFGPRNPNPNRRGVILEEVEEAMGDKPDFANNCLDVVPWQAPLGGAPMSGNAAELRGGTLEELMDTDDAQGCVSMEVEDEYVGGAVTTGVDGSEGGLHQQWQQHCMPPQLPPNRSTPLMWS